MGLYKKLMEETPEETKARHVKMDKMLDEIEKLTKIERPFKNNAEVVAFMKDKDAVLHI